MRRRKFCPTAYRPWSRDVNKDSGCDIKVRAQRSHNISRVSMRNASCKDFAGPPDPARLTTFNCPCLMKNVKLPAAMFNLIAGLSHLRKRFRVSLPRQSSPSPRLPVSMPLSKTRKNGAEQREKGSTTILNNYCICHSAASDATLASEADSPVISAPNFIA